METLALHHLEQHGLRFMARNHYTQRGELDLVMRDGNICVFVEVRYRRFIHHGSPLDTITPQKQQHLIRAAQHYLAHHALNMFCRFDVVSLTGNALTPDIVWVPHAFEAF